MHCLSNLFWNGTLHVSDRFTVHHPESSTVYTAIGSYSTTNKMHLLFQIIYSCKTLYVFRRSFRPSSGAQNCVYSNSICQTAAAYLELAAGSSRCLTYACYCMCSLSSWWWTERPPKHVELLIRIIIWETGASCWLYYRALSSVVRQMPG
jgi:hypothetical protein